MSFSFPWDLYIFIAITTDKTLIKRDVPPYEINGSGIPTTGKRPITIDIFTKDWIKIRLATPKIKYLEKLDFVAFDI